MICQNLLNARRLCSRGFECLEHNHQRLQVFMPLIALFFGKLNTVSCLPIKLLQLQEMSLTNLFWMISFPFLLSVATVKAQKFQNATNETLIFSKDAKGMEKQECCQEKNVGNVSYTLLADQYLGKLPDQCLNDCVYTITNSSSPKFCFARGLLSSDCFILLISSLGKPQNKKCEGCLGIAKLALDPLPLS